MNPIRSLRCTFLLACTTFNIDFIYSVTNMVSKTKILHRQELQEALQHKMQPLLQLYLEGHKFTSFCNYSVQPSFNQVYYYYYY